LTRKWRLLQPGGATSASLREIRARSMIGGDLEPRIFTYLVPPAGFAPPSPEVKLAPEFTWPEVELPVHRPATFRMLVLEAERFARPLAGRKRVYGLRRP
jgi:hypothetical protein